MRLFTRKSSRSSTASRGARKTAASKRPYSSHNAMFEQLEGRQMFSTSAATLAFASAPILTELIATQHETDAFGNNVFNMLGTATSPIEAVPGFNGDAMQTYHSNGAIYWSPSTGAHLVFGDIGAEYAKLSTETNATGVNVQQLIGLPTSDETNLANYTGGRTNTFQGGSIVWSTSTGAHVLYGDIGVEFYNLKNESDPYGTNLTGLLGLPTSDEAAIPGVTGGRFIDLQSGSIDWSVTTGAHVVYGDPGYVYGTLGGPSSWMGLPTSDESGSVDNRIVNYQNGYITWNPTTQAVVHNTSVNISTRYGDELVVTASGTRDSINVSQSGSQLTITSDGMTVTEPAPAAGLFVYTRGGTDSIDVGASVTTRTTLDTIDNAPTSIFSWGTNVITWADSNDSVFGTSALQSVNTFAGGVSKAQGAHVPVPSDCAGGVIITHSLWGTGPVVGDVNQNFADKDCYFLATLDAMAATNPKALMTHAVDMGDGTYVVDFKKGSTNDFVRVSDQFPINNGLLPFANPGPSGDLWAMVMESAFAYFRPAQPGLTANTMANTSGGQPSEVFNDFGIASTWTAPAAGDTAGSTKYLADENTLYTQVMAKLAAGKAVTMSTYEYDDNVIVRDHVYAVLGATKDAGGNVTFILQNPYGDLFNTVEPDMVSYQTVLKDVAGVTMQS